MQPIGDDPKDLGRRPGGHLTGPSEEEGLEPSSRCHMRPAKRVEHHWDEGDVVKSTEITVRLNMGIMRTLEAACGGRGIGTLVDLSSRVREGDIQTVPRT